MIEIDEVLVAMIASGCSIGQSVVEDLALDRLVLGRRLDHQVAVAEGLVGRRRPDALERRLALGVGDRALATTWRAMLPLIVASACVDALLA